MKLYALTMVVLLAILGSGHAATHRPHRQNAVHHYSARVHHYPARVHRYDDIEPLPKVAGYATVSWYGLHDGSTSRTAEGKRFNPYALGMAAPRDHPFGMRMLLTNTETGQSVIATVLDRNGPGVARGGRKYDLYLGTARALGIVSKGVTVVKVRVLARLSEQGVEVAEAP